MPIKFSDKQSSTQHLPPLKSHSEKFTTKESLAKMDF